MDCFARCIRGLEDIAGAEIAERLPADIVSTRHREIRFTTAAGVDELIDLRTVDDVFLLIGVIDGVGHTRAELARIGGALRGLDWDVSSAIGGTKPSTVEVVASFLGRRNFTRFEVEDVVGDVIAAMTRATYLPRRPETSVAGERSYRVHLEGDELVVGMRIAAVPLHRRPYKQHGQPGSLHPPVAAAMALLSDVVPGVTVVDPFCGSGTISVEAVRWLPTIRAVGSDVSPMAVADARRNATGTDNVSLLVADAARLPLATGSIDRLVTNPPWGGQAEFIATSTSSPVVERLIVDLMERAEVGVVLVDGEAMVDHVGNAVGPDLVVPISLFGRHPRIVVRRTGHRGPEGLMHERLVSLRNR